MLAERPDRRQLGHYQRQREPSLRHLCQVGEYTAGHFWSLPLGIGHILNMPFI